MLINPACLDPTPDNLFFPPRKGDYLYFQDPPPAPGASCEVEAAWTAEAAMLAYSRYGKTRMVEDDLTGILRAAGFTNVDTFGDAFVDNASTARGFFAANDTHAVLAFRGTEKDNLHDVEADADALLIEDGDCRVHRGFHVYLQTIWWRVAQVVGKYRSDHPQQPTYITGHSLGAALASLAFCSLQDPFSSLYTFGCPRVGDRAFCARLEALAEHRACYRVVDNQDVVTHVPIHAAGVDYEHPRITLLWLDAQGALTKNPPDPVSDWTDLAHLTFGFVNGHLLDLFPASLPRPLADHAPVRYCYWTAQALRPTPRATTT